MIKVYHYVFRAPEDFRQTLDEVGIRYYMTETPFPDGLSPLFIFDIKSNSKRFEDQYGIVSCYAKPFAVWSNYTKKEIESAAWMLFRPHRHCIDITNFEDAYFYYCPRPAYTGGSAHIHDQEQVADLRIAQIPPRTKTVFYASDTGYGEIFSDERIFDFVRQHEISGVSFRPVFTKTGKPRENFYQILSENVITRDQIARGFGEGYSECPYCYQKQIVLDDEHMLHLKMSETDLHGDFWMTESIFGEGVAHPCFLISQRFYRLLKENRMLGSVRTEPVCFVE